MAKMKTTAYGKRGTAWSHIMWQKAEKGLQHALEFELKPQFEKEIAKAFIDTQESFLRDLPTHETPTMPFITGNLHDSIGSVVSVRGRVVKASYADPVAKTESKITGKQIFKSTKMGQQGMPGYRAKIVGSMSAFNMVRSLHGKYPNNLAITMFVAVPYALRPEEHGPHAGYLSNLRKLFAYALEAEFRRAEYKHILMVKGNLDQYIQIAYDAEDIRIARENTPSKKTSKKSGYMGSAKPGMKML